MKLSNLVQLEYFGSVKECCLTIFKYIFVIGTTKVKLFLKTMLFKNEKPFLFYINILTWV